MTASITWHGHATFQITAPECNILIDPFFTGNPAARTAAEDIEKPDLVLVTHLHSDHAGDAVGICKRTGAALGGIVGLVEVLQSRGVPAAQIINGIGFNIGGTIHIRGAAITMTEAFHTSEAGAPAGYIIRLADGYTIYHAGDTGIFAGMAVWGELFAVDLALLPAGGLFTMDGRQAARAAALLKTRFATPMHWGTFPVLAQDTAEFESELAARAPGCRLFRMEPGQTAPLLRI
ncbi:MAG: metal-dependent hydrolase [Desulfovibrio sp.]|jgi:L-ascorbate metabolism protein UlaG (beta-lactamase superfamily)|nr:metal-dependent hydrolase [Desulfovibrio sp.]